MKKDLILPMTNLDRRRFLLGSCTGLGSIPFVFSDSISFAQSEDKTKAMKVRLFFSLHGEVQEKFDWPNMGFDFRPVMKQMTNALNANVAGVEFIPTLADGPATAKQIIEEDTRNGNIAGYVVAQMNCWNKVIQSVVETGKPVLYYDYLYAGSGGFLCYTASLIHTNAPNFGFISSEKFDDVVSAAQAFTLVKDGKSIQEFVAAITQTRLQRTQKPGNLPCKKDDVSCLPTTELLDKLKGKKLLDIGGPRVKLAPAAKKYFDIDIVELDFAPLNQLWEKADRGETTELVQRWKTRAKEIVGVPDSTLMDSARMALAQRELLKIHNAQGLTVHCLRGFYGKHIHAYPCLGFFELCNEGLVGGCECDITSALTMLILSTLTNGRTGFISDPVLDISTRTIIYAHCVAMSKPFGPTGVENPFSIMTHSEDRAGASIRSTLPEGYMTTTLEINLIRGEILFHQALTVGNSTSDRACRTKLVCEPLGDFEKLFTKWHPWGWHRVTVYGDLKKQIFELADRVGLKIVEEA